MIRTVASGRRLRHAVLGLAWLAMPLAAQNITLNLKDAEIRSVIETVAELTGKSFIIDPRVQGKVTVLSSRPLNERQVYEVFLSILELNGFAAIDSGEVIKIVPAAAAKTAPTPLVSDSNRAPGDAEVTRVIELTSVRAGELVPLLRPLLPQEGHLAAHASSNILIVSGKAANVARLEQVIRRIDQDGDSEIEVVRLLHASAQEVTKMLSALQADLSGKAPAAGARAAEGDMRFVADTRSNSVILSGDRSQRLQARTLIAHLDTPLESSGNIHVFYLRYAKAADVAKVLTGIVESEKKEQQDAKATATVSEVSIQAEETTNALVIRADPEHYRALDDVIRKLDIRRAQVLVEGVIAEVSASKSAELGVQWRFGNLEGTGAFGGTNFNQTGQGINPLSFNPAGIGDGLTLGYIDQTLSVLGEEILNIGFLIRALAADGDTNILSTPSLVTMDNHEAEIVIAQNVPFLTGQYANQGATTPGINPFQTIERKDVGLTLRLTPQINEGDAIKMNIEQEVSNLSTNANSGAVDLITTKRQIKTSVIVDDGRMIVLGGLIDDTLQQGVGKVPLLGDLPLLGGLFRYRTDSVNKRNLMIFLRPQIIRDHLDSERISLGKYNFIRDRFDEQRSREEMLLPQELKPRLPALPANE